MNYLLTHINSTIGTASIVQSEGEGDQRKILNRFPIVPGSWDASGNWIATDIATIPQPVRAQVIALWSAGVITAYRNANPYVPPRVPTAEENQRTARRINAAAKTLRTRLMAATNAEVDAYVDANVTNLADVRTMFKQILKIIAADMREE